MRLLVSLIECDSGGGGDGGGGEGDEVDNDAGSLLLVCRFMYMYVEKEGCIVQDKNSFSDVYILIFLNAKGIIRVSCN